MLNKNGTSVFLTNKCNMNCSYCYVDRCFDSGKVTPEEITEYIDWYFRDTKRTGKDRYEINVIGGESFLALDTIIAGLDKLIELCERDNCTGKFRISTNGTMLLNTKVKAFINKYIVESNSPVKVTLIISVDGLKEVHDKNRVMINGEGSFDRIMEGIRYWIPFINPNISISCTFNNDSIYSIYDAFNFFVGEGLRYLKMNVTWDDHYSKEEGMIILENFIKAFKRIKELGISDEIYMSYFEADEIGRRPFGKRERLCSCGDNFVLGPKRLVYPCIDFITIKNDNFSSIVGELKDGRVEENQNPFLPILKNATSQLNPECEGCPVHRNCAPCSSVVFRDSSYSPGDEFKTNNGCGWAYAVSTLHSLLRQKIL